MINAAKKNIDNFYVAVNNVAATKTKRTYTHDQQADLDIKTSNNLIGDIINLSQELNTLIWHLIHKGATVEETLPIYLDVCKLNIMSGIEIDKAKKEFNVNNSKELKNIRQKYHLSDNDGRTVKPNFFAAKDKSKHYYDADKKVYKKHHATMDYLQEAVNKFSYSQLRHSGQNDIAIPFSDIIDDSSFISKSTKYSQIDRVLEIVRQYDNEVKEIYASDIDPKEKPKFAFIKRIECNDYIGNLSFSDNTMIYLLKSIEKVANKDIRRRLFNTLFGYPNTDFYRLLKRSQHDIFTLQEDPDGNREIYGFRFKTYKKQPISVEIPSDDCP